MVLASALLARIGFAQVRTVCINSPRLAESLRNLKNLTLAPCFRKMFALLFDLGDYATTYRATRDAYLKAANELKLATGPYKAARDAYVAGTATYTKSLYE